MAKHDLNYLRFLSGVISEETYYDIQERGGDFIASCQDCGINLDAMDVQGGRCPGCMSDFKANPPKMMDAAQGGGKKGLMKKVGLCKRCAYPLTAMDVRSGSCPNCMGRIESGGLDPMEKGPAPVKYNTVYKFGL